jgi:hypothetical protein
MCVPEERPREVDEIPLEELEEPEGGRDVVIEPQDIPEF